MRNRTSDLRIPCSDALSLSHRDSTVSEVYNEVHITHVLHTARISNVDSVMFVDRNKRDGKFWARQRNRERCEYKLVNSPVPQMGSLWSCLRLSRISLNTVPTWLDWKKYKSSVKNHITCLWKHRYGSWGHCWDPSVTVSRLAAIDCTLLHSPSSIPLEETT